MKVFILLLKTALIFITIYLAVIALWALGEIATDVYALLFVIGTVLMVGICSVAITEQDVQEISNKCNQIYESINNKK